jgi:hypothetical protein
MHQPMHTIPATPWFSQDCQDYVLEGNANKKFEFGAKETSQKLNTGYRNGSVRIHKLN